MTKALKFLRTALNDASAPSEVHKASVMFMRELKALDLPISDIEKALESLTTPPEVLGRESLFRSLKDALDAQSEELARKRKTFTSGCHKSKRTDQLSNGELFEIYQDPTYSRYHDEIRKELDKRGLI